MSGCEGACPREAVQQDAVSLGVIGDSEEIARGAYYPSHADKKGKIRPGLIPRAHLWTGQCSVWRTEPPGLPVDKLVDMLQKSRPDDPLKSVPVVKANEIRGLVVQSGGRAFCVVDECDCDQNGGKHPAHAHISICQVAKTSMGTEKSDEFIQAHRDLVNLYKSAPAIWVEQQAA